MRIVNSLRVMPWAWRANPHGGLLRLVRAMGGGLVLAMGLGILLGDPKTARILYGDNLLALMAPFLLYTFALPSVLRRERRAADPFLHLVPVSAGERRLALLLVDYGPTVALATLYCFLLPQAQQARGTAMALAAFGVGLGAFGNARSYGAPGRWMLVAIPTVAALLLAVQFLPPAPLALLGAAGLALDVRRAFRDDLAVIGTEGSGQARAGRLASLVLAPRSWRRSILGIFIAGEKLAAGTVGIVGVAVSFRLWRPEESFMQGAMAAAVAGIAISRFLWGPAGKVLALWPVSRRKVVTVLLGFGIATAALPPAAGWLLTRARTDAGIAARLETLGARAGIPACADAGCDRRLEGLWRRELHVHDLPTPALVPGPGPAHTASPAMIAFYRKALAYRSALAALGGMVFLGLALVLERLFARYKQWGLGVALSLGFGLTGMILAEGFTLQPMGPSREILAVALAMATLAIAGAWTAMARPRLE